MKRLLTLFTLILSGIHMQAETPGNGVESKRMLEHPFAQVQEALHLFGEQRVKGSQDFRITNGPTTGSVRMFWSDCSPPRPAQFWSGFIEATAFENGRTQLKAVTQIGNGHEGRPVDESVPRFYLDRIVSILERRRVYVVGSFPYDVVELNHGKEMRSTKKEEGQEEARAAVTEVLKKLDLVPLYVDDFSQVGIDYPDVQFAVVLLTGDDRGGRITKAVEGQKSRPSQEVILQWGYLLGKLGSKRVCALTRGEVEVPRGIRNPQIFKLDDAGAWKMRLAAQMSASGLPVDLLGKMK